MIIANCIQSSPEWFEARIGIPTASCFDKIVTSKGEPSKQKTKYMYQLAAERITRKSEELYTNAAMERGKEAEAEARSFYEMLHDVKIEQVGFCYPNDKKRFGCSPDGLVGEKGMTEFKCPMSHTHIEYFIDNSLPTEYIQQIQGQLFVTGREWCDFVSYYPGLKPLIIRVNRDEKFIKALSIELEIFCDGLDDLVKKIK